MTKTRARVLLLLPLVAFAAFAALFLSRLESGDPSLVPSVLIGKPVPSFELPAVAGLSAPDGGPLPGLASSDLRSGVFLVNVFSSWCASCRVEMATLAKIAADIRFKVVGIDYKDTDDQARRFLARFGNPYAAAGADAKGRVGIDWGVYGVPETYVVADGTIVYKLVGPVTEENFAKSLKPAIDKALAGTSAGKG